ncbi:sigma-70 family RNA polymerase sigma factor [Tenacibaculum soleae]|uniref:RNA polymerase sigma factor n=1 Tax=Tenacibaculum soleae TaxID=447689 RepID=UPI0026E1242B|nr:sigma-70 family RNA polymerase sigma factor [Tenacibaculum soleae]MDO6744761.1 sigma-70 family RNA polymerase sigma factor [Tenacibaculum soleae]
MKEIKSVCSQVVYKKIYDLYADSLYGFMIYKCGDSIKAQDFVQEAFVKLWINCSKVIYEKAKSYLFTVGNNFFLDDYAHQKVVLKHQKLGVKSITKETPEYLLEEQEFLKKLQNAITNLPEKQRDVFLMNRIDKKKYKEMAEELEISVKAVEKRMTLALKTLRTQIKGI